MKKNVVAGLLALTLAAGSVAPLEVSAKEGLLPETIEVSANGADIIKEETKGPWKYTLDADGVFTIAYDKNEYSSILGAEVFRDLTEEEKASVKTVVISSGITGIASGDSDSGNLFYGFENLSSISIPETVTTIRKQSGNMFEGCKSLSTITVEAENPVFDSRDHCNAIIETASNALIAGCKDTTIPADVTEITEYAFFQVGLQNITLPESVTNIDVRAFYGCEELENITIDENNPVFDSRDHCNAIIKTDENTLIKGCKSTTIPESVKTIGEYAFFNCSGLKSIDIPTGVTEIGTFAFLDCNDLTGVYLPEGLLKIGSRAFFQCKNLRSVRLPASITEIEGNFVENSAVDDIIFCGTQREWENVEITELPGNCYRGVLAKVLRYHALVKTEKVPASCVTDGAEAYWTCSACGKMYQTENVAEDPKEITAPIVIPATGKHSYTVKKVDAKYLASAATCTEPEKYYYSCSVCGTSEKNNSHTFAVGEAKGHCWDSGKVTKEATTQAEGVRTYTCTVCQDTKTEKIAKLKPSTNNNNSNNSNNNTVKKGTKVTIKGYKYTVKNSSEVTFTGVKNKKAKKITIPATVKIRNKKYKVTAMSAKSLKGVQAKTIVVGNNVKNIGNSAMENCKKLTNVTLGKNVTRIGKNVLKSDKKLKTITVKSTKLKSVGKSAFKGIHSKAKIKVPAKKYSAYKKLFKGKGQGKKVTIVKAK